MNRLIFLRPASVLQAPRRLPSITHSASRTIRSLQVADVTSAVGAKNSSEHTTVLPSSVYVHIPFCKRRCFYCDFPIVAVGERTDSNKDHMDSTMTDYVDLICREIRVAAKANPSKPLQTIFFGGGTPSLLPPPLLLRILSTLDANFGINTGAEVSMEMDPGTFTTHSLNQLISGGLTRVSMGVQSFSSAHLQSCGRSHALPDVYSAIDAIHASGLANWSLDLISSLPHQTLIDWEHSLQQAVAASPTHISVYDLQIEEGTLFNKWYKPGQSPLPSNDKAAEFYQTASTKLQEAGFSHYEISNYAKPGFQCRHNLVYWNSLPYFAFGLGSTSYLGLQRFSRPKKLKQYREFVDNFESLEGRVSWPQDSKEERALDAVMLSLRLARGLDLQEFQAMFGGEFTALVCEAMLPFVSSGHVAFLNVEREIVVDMEVVKEEIRGLGFRVLEQRELAFVRLTDPHGFLLSNEVIASIFSALPGGENSQYRLCTDEFEVSHKTAPLSLK